MGRFSAGKFYLWYGQPVNTPFVTPPMSLRGFLIVCVLSVTGTLVYGVATELSFGDSPNYSGTEMIGIAVLYFLLPILAAHTIATNHAISRPLIGIYIGAVAIKALWLLEAAQLSDNLRGGYVLLGVLVLSVLFWWLFLSTKICVYYRLITGGELPTDLDRSVEEIMSPGRVERLFGRFAQTIAPYTESAVVVLVIVSVLLAWVSM